MGKELAATIAAAGAYEARRPSLPPVPSPDAIWMHFAAILPTPLPMKVCHYIYSHVSAYGSLYLSSTRCRYVAAIAPPRGLGDVPLVVDHVLCGPHRCLAKRVRLWLGSAPMRQWMQEEP